MKIADYGEDRLVAELTRGLPHVGDDCAVVGGPRDRKWRLLKTDAILEGVHFLPTHAPRQIGWKALARTISDIAAMGGTPREALVTLALPPEREVAWVKALYAGLRKCAQQFGVEIVGGETSRSPGPLFISIALTGTVARKHCVKRGGGKNGDTLFVTGRLGGSLAGKHLTFQPRVAEAQWLAQNFAIRAMMDLSDGLGSDLPRLARASGLGWELFEEQLPLAKGCTPQNAIRDGEDYELLFALAPQHGAALKSAWHRQFPKLPLTEIGFLKTTDNRNPQLLRGYDHFPQH
ncbi:MAG: thiamine-phosphate kinase [Chthoniobacteraceae bacterium]